MTKWNKEGFPHKGWKCLDVTDLAEYATPGDTITLRTMRNVWK